MKAIIYDAAGSHALRDSALDNIRKREFEEPYEHRFLALGYLQMGMNDNASDHLKLLFSLAPFDPAGLFGQTLLSQRRKDAAGAKKEVAALFANPKAKEVLGEDPAALFTAEGGVKPGADAGRAEHAGAAARHREEGAGNDPVRRPGAGAYRPSSSLRMYSFAVLTAVAASPDPAVMRRTLPG